MNYTRNIAKKLILLCSISTLGFSAPDPVTLPIQTPKTPSAPTHTQAKKNFGFFFGGGIGGGIQALKVVWFREDKVENKNFPSFVFDIKAGIYQYFNRWVGLRYYYSYDLNFNAGQPEWSYFFRPVMNWVYEGAYVSIATHSINIDSIFNVYSDEKFDFGLIVGTGFALTEARYSTRIKDQYFPLRGFDAQFFGARANVGMRFLIEKKYAIEFLSKIPLSPYQWIANVTDGPHGGNQSRGGNLFYRDYQFALDFVVEF